MRTVTFYSYKGGVGRTLAVANTAIRLAREGLKVFALDFDLEAPGLHHKFNLFPKREPLVIERGLLDFLYEFVTFDRFPDTLAGHVIDVSERGSKASSIHFMPAGRAPSAKYAEHLARIDWHALFYAEGGDGVPLFLELKERIRAEYAPDVLLIDARTGITEMGGVATSLLADQVFALTLKHHEHLEGTRAILRGMRRAPRLEGDAPVRAEVIVTRLRGVGDDVAVDREKRRVKAYLNEPAENLADTVCIDDVLVIRAEAGLEQEERLLLGGVEAELPLLRDYLRIVSRILEPDARIAAGESTLIEETPAVVGPPPHNLPTRRHFVGREGELDVLAAALADPGAATVTHSVQASLYGFGGVGKTALALEYAHLHLAQYPGGVWWVLAEGAPIDALVRLVPVLKENGTAALRRALGSIPLDIPAVKLAEAVRLALQNQEAPSLLVLDNVSEPGWSEHMPCGEVRVLATAREGRFALGKAAPLGVLPPEAARKLAIDLAGEREGVELDALDRVVVKELGGLAVAVEMAARAVGAIVPSWIAYEERIGAEMGRLLGDTALLGDYPRGVFAALDLSIERCPPGTPARRLLEGSAVFAPEAVPLEWAMEAAGLDAEDGAATKALEELGQLGLVEVDATVEALSMHRLLRLRIRQQVDKGIWKQVSERAAACVADWLRETDDVTRMPEVETRRAHVNEVLLAAEAAGSKREAITVANYLAGHLQRRAELVEARALFERALAEAERLEPANPALVSKQLSNLAQLLKDLGRAAEARPLLERALHIDEATYGSEHWHIANVISNLAAAYMDQGQVEPARSLLTRALSISEATHGPEHANVAIILANLAAAHLILGRRGEALLLITRALAIEEKVHGPEHPAVAHCLSTLATLHLGSGEAAEALALAARALEIDDKTYGPEHPTVAIRLSNLAMVHKHLGDAPEARSLLERAFRIAEKLLEPGHPTRTLITKNLASL